MGGQIYKLASEICREEGEEKLSRLVMYLIREGEIAISKKSPTRNGVRNCIGSTISQPASIKIKRGKTRP